MTELSRLERVDLRDIWQTEAKDFTPWLAQDENLAVLGEAIGIELELEAQEKSVGPFRADILCRDISSRSDSDSMVLIENQLERTDHTHLGQLLTYASGLHTVTIVWVAAKFSEEHRAALDWLNEITDDTFRFFGLEVELWRIGNSPAAPKFNVISKPNDWSRTVSKAARKISEDDLNPTRANYLHYWTKFSEYVRESSAIVRPQKPSPYHWTNVSIGRSGFGMAALGSTRDDWIAIELNMTDDHAKPYFYLLHEDKNEIESDLGFEVEWLEMLDKKSSRIRCYSRGFNPMNQDDWQEQFEWFKEKLEAFDRVFRPRIQNLNANDWDEENRLEASSV